MPALRRNDSILEGNVLFEPFEVELGDDGKVHIDQLDESMHAGPVDLDDLLRIYAVGQDGKEILFPDDEFYRTHQDMNNSMKKKKSDLNADRNETQDDEDDDDDDDVDVDDDIGEYYDLTTPRFFNNPHNRRLFDTDASLIPGSPFSKPSIRPTNRPRESLRIARYTSTLAFLGTVGTIIFLLFNAIYTYEQNVGRIIIEMILALLSFFGIFWNIYFTISCILKCFIPKQAFKTNTKYCSIIPESKDARDEWLDVTIQIPIYRESLVQTLMPTFRSCVAARMSYEQETKYAARCNIVVCDDGMMVMLRDNFAAAEMLWQQIVTTHGRVLKLSKLLATVPRASRSHLKGLRSRDVYDVFHRMLYYYHYDIGFVARSTLDRPGKFKKASNLNSHLRLALGAQQRVQENPEDWSYEDAMLQEVHNEDGSRFAMFGNDVRIGHLICVNDADTRMAESVIAKTVPEFLNDKTLGFTQHATKTLSEQRTESYYTKMLSYYTDTLYQGHYLLSSILGCHPPLVGHSVFLRREAIQQCGRVRTLRKAQQWLKSIGLNFVPVDQVGFANLQAQNRIEYWSESNVSYDFELMIHLYSLGFNGRYVNYEDCEFQEGITRNFNEEAVRCRKLALGAHELVFHPFQDMLGRGIFTPVFRTFMTCEIPSYYKIFLTAHLCSYASGGSYILIFVLSSVLQLFDKKTEVDTISIFNPAGIIIISFVIYYVIGYLSFIIALLRMNAINKKLSFQEHRKKWFNGCCIVYTQIRYCFLFQFLFHNVATFTFYFLGSMDHMLARPTYIGSTNKDFIKISRVKALCDTISLNLGSWVIAFIMILLAYATVLQSFEWDASITPDSKKEYLQHALFAAPAAVLAVMAFVVPIILNPYILGWPFLRQKKIDIPIAKPPIAAKRPTERTLSLTSSKALDDNALKSATTDERDTTFLTADEIDLETGSLTTNDLRLTFTQSPERLGQQIRSDPTFINASDVKFKTTERLTSVLESRATSGGRRRSQPTVEQSLQRVETARMSSDGLLRRTVPLKGPSRDGRYNSPPVRRLGHGNKSPTATPPHSPIGRRNASISPGRRRQPSTIKAVKSDEWGFPMSLNTTF